MAWFESMGRTKAGFAVSARTLNAPMEASEWSSRSRADAPLAIDTTSFGPMMSYAGMIYEEWIGITATAITPRSGGTPGKGNVTLQSFDGTALSPMPDNNTVEALNFSEASGGIPQGLYCVVTHLYGEWWVTTVECPSGGGSPTPTPTGTGTGAVAGSFPAGGAPAGGGTTTPAGRDPGGRREALGRDAGIAVARGAIDVR